MRFQFDICLKNISVCLILITMMMMRRWIGWDWASVAMEYLLLRRTTYDIRRHETCFYNRSIVLSVLLVFFSLFSVNHDRQIPLPILTTQFPAFYYQNHNNLLIIGISESGYDKSVRSFVRSRIKRARNYRVVSREKRPRFLCLGGIHHSLGSSTTCTSLFSFIPIASPR